MRNWAYTCRPSIRACTCMVLIHADAYSHTLWTNAEWYMWNMREPIWMETERANMNETQFSSYPAHDYDPDMLTCRPSKHVPCVYLVCKSLYNGKLCIKNKETLPLTRRGLRSSLEIIRGPAERSRIMKRQLNAQEDTSLKNIRRSVHELFARKFEHEN